MPVYLFIFAGAIVGIEPRIFIQSFSTVLLAPFLAAIIVRKVILSSKGEQWLNEKVLLNIDTFQSIFLMLAITAMFASQGIILLDNITVAAVIAANVADGEAVEELLEQRTENISEPLNKLSGDTAYGGAKMRVDMQERNIELVAKVPPATNPKGHFTKDEFNIDLENKTITCSANHTIELKKAGSHKFSAVTCNECILLAQCTSSKNGRIVVIHEHEAILQTARREQETPEFKEKYRLRPRVEGENVLRIASFLSRTPHYWITPLTMS